MYLSLYIYICTHTICIHVFKYCTIYIEYFLFIQSICSISIYCHHSIKSSCNHLRKTMVPLVKTLQLHQKIGVGPPNHPSKDRVFHEINNPFWGFCPRIFGLTPIFMLCSDVFWETWKIPFPQKHSTQIQHKSPKRCLGEFTKSIRKGPPTFELWTVGFSL